MFSFNEYQTVAAGTAIYPGKHTQSQESIVYTALGLVGESGEVAEKVKKWIRDGKWNREDVIKEVGDVLWYIAALSAELGYTLEHVALMNLDKLRDRKENGKIGGEGDHR